MLVNDVEIKDLFNCFLILSLGVKITGKSHI
jgi:hypothetical protein